jgi:hypothetical protein
VRGPVAAVVTAVTIACFAYGGHLTATYAATLDDCLDERLPITR